MGKCKCCTRTFMLMGETICAYCLEDMRDSHGTQWEHTPATCWRRRVLEAPRGSATGDAWGLPVGQGTPFVI